MDCNLVGWPVAVASNLVLMASNLLAVAMASNLKAAAHNLLLAAFSYVLKHVLFEMPPLCRSNCNGLQSSSGGQ